MRAACLIEEVQRLLDRQSGLYSVYSDAIHKYKSSKDATAFANARKKLDGDYRSISNQIAQVQNSLNKEQPEASEKVSTQRLPCLAPIISIQLLFIALTLGVLA